MEVSEEGLVGGGEQPATVYMRRNAQSGGRDKRSVVVLVGPLGLLERECMSVCGWLCSEFEYRKGFVIS